MMNKKNKMLATTLSVIVMLILFTIVFENKSSKTEINRDMFALEDTASITMVSLSKVSGKAISLRKTSKGWQMSVNQSNEDQQRVDPLKIKYLQAVLFFNRVRKEITVGKPNDLEEDQVVKVSISFGEVIETFYVGGNAIKTKSYWSKDGEMYYEIGVDSYNAFVSGVFNIVTPYYFTSKVVFKDFESIAGIRFKQFNKNGSTKIKWEIKQNELGRLTFVKAQVPVTDVLNALYQYKYIDYVGKGKVKAYDSLVTTLPKYSIELRYDNEQVKSFFVYPQLPGDPYYLSRIEGQGVYGRLPITISDRIANLDF